MWYVAEVHRLYDEVALPPIVTVCQLGGEGEEKAEWEKLFAKSTTHLVLIYTLERAWWGTVDKPSLAMLFKKNLYALFSKHIRMK